MRILAIDPGNEESALLAYDTTARRPLHWLKVPNAEALDIITMAPLEGIECLAVEMIASYGMPVGETTFETCVWIGRFIECWEHTCSGRWEKVYRRSVKLHLCGSARAKDANIRQALIDRYGPGKAKAVGLKASPGVLYGMKADCWQALAVAITAAETSL